MTTCCWKFWKFCLNLNRTRLHKITRLRARIGTLTWKFLPQKFVIYFFTSNKKLTIHRKTQLMFSFQFMLKSQQKVDIKLSKICQSHHHASLNCCEDSRKYRRRFKLFVGLFVELVDSLKQGTTGNWILMTQMLALANSAWVCWLCWLFWCSGKQASFYIIWMHYTLMNLYSYSVLSLQTTLT